MADLDDISPDEIPSVSDDPHATGQPVANPDAVAQEDEDNPMQTGLDEGEVEHMRDDPSTA